jgi:hypothetical protein
VCVPEMCVCVCVSFCLSLHYVCECACGCACVCVCVCADLGLLIICEVERGVFVPERDESSSRNSLFSHA